MQTFISKFKDSQLKKNLKRIKQKNKRTRRQNKRTGRQNKRTRIQNKRTRRQNKRIKTLINKSNPSMKSKSLKWIDKKYSQITKNEKYEIKNKTNKNWKRSWNSILFRV